jgi:MFS family permease
MFRMARIEKYQNSRSLAFGSVFLIVNALIWYFTAASILENAINNVSDIYSPVLSWGLHFGSLILSLILGALITEKIQSKRFLVYWTLIGVFAPFVLLTINVAQGPIVLLLATLFGISFGLGMPNCMEFFTKTTEPRNRGKYSGIIMLCSGVGIALFGSLEITNIAIAVLILVIWRLLGLIPAPFLQSPVLGKNKIKFQDVIRHRAFILYLIPWLMFSLVGYLGVPIQTSILGQSIIAILMLIEAVLMGIFALISGFLLDRLGRKRIAMIGFILMGIGYAVLGIYPYEMASWIFYTALDGIAWGVFYVIFVITIWGDLSPNEKSGKYYAIGVLPFFISKFLQIAVGDYISTVKPEALFSFVAFFLFIAVLPLVYAPETLPEKVMKDRDLKSYIENAKKKAQKESSKPDKKEQEPQPESEEKEKPPKEDKVFEEAKKLAEQYY